MISSTRNPKIQRLRTLVSRARARREEESFIVEGVRLAEEVVASGWTITAVFYTDRLDDRGQTLTKTLASKRVPSEEVSESVMKAISDTKTPQGILLEVESKELPIASKPTLVLILDAISDPGNLGTLLRSAAAASADVVLLAPGCADPFSPKVLRSGMGAHFRLPIRELNWQAIGEFCGKNGLSVFLAETEKGIDLYRADLTKSLAFIVGGEARGTGKEASTLSTDQVRIPMPGRMESLNAATAGSLLLFEAVRQRLAKAGAQ